MNTVYEKLSGDVVRLPGDLEVVHKSKWHVVFRPIKWHAIITGADLPPGGSNYYVFTKSGQTIEDTFDGSQGNIDFWLKWYKAWHIIFEVPAYREQK